MSRAAVFILVFCSLIPQITITLGVDTSGEYSKSVWMYLQIWVKITGFPLVPRVGLPLLRPPPLRDLRHATDGVPTNGIMRIASRDHHFVNSIIVILVLGPNNTSSPNCYHVFQSLNVYIDSGTDDTKFRPFRI